jgi:fibronectin type 3 domain-containing protein
MYTISVSFEPIAAGNFSGTLSVASNATNPTVQIGLSGSATAQQSSQHSVTLNWTASTSPVSGYNVYRSAVAGGPYAKLTASSDASPSFEDTNVAAGQRYFYVVTSVNSSNVESAYSNQVVAAVP